MISDPLPEMRQPAPGGDFHPGATEPGSTASRVRQAGRAVALAGVIAPLFMIGILKFTQFEIEALKPLISHTPWLTPLYSIFGYAGASYFLGVVEIATALLFLASPWSPRSGVVAGVLGTITFLLTVSIMVAIPIWEAAAGGFPWLNSAGGFLIKDVSLLGISLVVLGDSLLEIDHERALLRDGLVATTSHVPA